MLTLHSLRCKFRFSELIVVVELKNLERSRYTQVFGYRAPMGDNSITNSIAVDYSLRNLDTRYFLAFTGLCNESNHSRC